MENGNDKNGRVVALIPNKSATEQELDILRSANDQVGRHTFAVGDSIEWIPKMRCRKYPTPGKACIVVALIDTPYADVGCKESGSNIAEWRYDIIVSSLDEDGDVLRWPMDSRFFRPASM